MKENILMRYHRHHNIAMECDHSLTMLLVRHGRLTN